MYKKDGQFLLQFKILAFVIIDHMTPMFGNMNFLKNLACWFCWLIECLNMNANGKNNKCSNIQGLHLSTY